MSEQALVDCSWGYDNNGCDGGETVHAYEWIMDNNCIPTKDTYGQYLMQVSGRGSVYFAHVWQLTLEVYWIIS